MAEVLPPICMKLDSLPPARAMVVLVSGPVQVIYSSPRVEVVEVDARCCRSHSPHLLV